ncbi:MAG TPA: carboxypeptidase-like regulatory domain-containing protein [Bryobacteraceae bacterium]
MVALLLLFSMLAVAQSQNSTISGTVTDATGAVVPNADLSLTALQREITLKAKSGPDGLFSFPNLEPGAYELKVAAAGFRPFVQRGITLNVNQLVRADVRLEVGTDIQTVEVQANVSQLNFENAARAEGVTPETINELPLIVSGGPRNSAQFLVLLPGVSTGGGNNSYDARINGGMATGDEAIMDGVSMQEGFMSQSGMVSFFDFRMTPDMISEFRVLTSAYEPEYGSSTGGQLIATTKSGGSQYHGGAFEYLRNKSLNATQWQIDRPAGDVRGKDNEHEYGFFIGGQVKIPKIYNSSRSRTFFFTDVEFFRQRGGVSVNPLTVPTDQERAGDFTDWGKPIYDPLTTRLNPNFNPNADVSAGNPKYIRDQFSCDGRLNVICPSRITSQALGFLKFLPSPNKSGVENNYLPPTAIPDGILGDANHFLIKIDQYFGDKDHFAATIWRQMTPAKFLSVLPLQLATETYSDPQNSWVNRLNYDHTFSATVLNHFAFGYLNRNEGYGSINYKYAADLPQIDGVPGHRYPPQVNFNSNGYTGFGNSTGLNNEDVTTRPTYVANDMVTWVRGRHTIKFGGEYRAIGGNAHNAGNESGTFTFDAAQTGLPTYTGSGNAMASYLIGAVNNASVNLITVRGRYVRQKAYVWHVGDTWKVNSKISVNYGLRWDKFTPSWEKYNNMSFFDFGPNPGAGGRPGRLGFAGDKFGDASTGRQYPEQGWNNGFGPRLGIAYGVNDKTVVRTGYGVFYTQAFYPDWSGGVDQAGFNNSVTLNPTGLGELDPAFYWQNGMNIPQSSRPPFIDPSFRNGQDAPIYRPKDANRLSYAQQWNFTVEHQLTGNAMISLGYVGNKGTRLPSQISPINVLNPSLLRQYGSALSDQFSGDSPVAGVPAPYAGWAQQLNDAGACAPTVAQALLPFPQYCSGITGLNENLGMSTYHSFQLKVEKRFASGLYTLLSYTHSKLLTSAAGITQASSATWNGSTGSVISPFEMSRNKSLAPDDVPNNFTLGVVYELPVGKGKRWLNNTGGFNYVVGGWQITSTAKYSSGTPFWFRSSNCGVPGQFRLSCIPAVINGKSPFLTDLSSYDPGTKQPVFDVNAFEPVSQFSRVDYYGAGPRISNFRGLAYKNLDIGLGKKTMIGEKVTFLLRAEAFNALNLHNFTCTGNGGCQAFNTTVGDANFGKWSGSVTAPRNVQLVGRIEF